jgi:hypothetical protein
MAEQWERVDQNLKRLIRRCERDGVTYREDTDFDALFRLHWQTHQRKGAPLYLPEAAFRRFFERVHACGLARLGHAVFDDKVVASQLMLVGPHPVSHTVCAGADEDYLRLGASAFLRWHAFLALHRDGYAANDLTDAALNPVTRFKSQLGVDLTPTFFNCAIGLVAVPSRGRGAAHQDWAAETPAPPPSGRLRVNGANLICESLRELGVSHVFGLPGTQNVLLYEALRTRGMRSIVASDEGAAAFMAAGYARASGRVGVLTTIPGPGFVYALAGIVEAQHDSVPLLWLTLRQADNGRAFQLQQIDQAAMAKPVVKRCMLVERTDELAQALREAHAEAAAGEPGPVLLEIASAALEAQCVRAESPTPTVADAVDIRPLAALLAQSARPLIYAGQGAQGAAEEVRRLAGRLRAPVLFTSSGRGVLPDTDPLAFVQDFSTGLGSVVPELIERADTVLALGCKFTHNGSGGGRLRLPENKLVRIDSSAAVLSANYPARLAVQARVEDALAQLAGVELPRSQWAEHDLS